MVTCILTTGIDGILFHQLEKRFNHISSIDLQRLAPGDLNRTALRENAGVVLCDARGGDPSALIDRISEEKASGLQTPVILITQYSSEEIAIKALRAGFADYLKTPVSISQLVLSIKSALDGAPSANVNRPQPGYPAPLPFMITRSPAMLNTIGHLKRVADADCTVLITGETGTGKELAAEMVHAASPRARKQMIPLNCASLPDHLVESELFGYERGTFTGADTARSGKFEQAAGGTLFLDEIGEMSLPAQAKILRTIETKKVYRLGAARPHALNVRVVAATNQNLEQLVVQGRFRQDLFYRLNVARADLPPLRDRKEDIMPLIGHFIDTLNRRHGRAIQGFSPSAMQTLVAYHWPGNVRELKNLVEAAFINLPGNSVTTMDLPAQFQARLKAVSVLPENERDRLLAALYATHWNKSQAARRLNWSRMTVYRKMNKYNVADK